MFVLFFMLIILKLFKYAYFKLFIINKKIETKSTAADVGFESGLLAWSANAHTVEPTSHSTSCCT